METLLRQAGLGGMLSPAVRLTGGFLHEMFRAETNAGVFAVKRLNPEVMRRPEAADNMRRSESIARLARANGLPACAARVVNGDVLLRSGEAWYMVYDFAPGRTLRPKEITPAHCRAMGGFLRRMHALPASGARYVPAAPDHPWRALCPENADMLLRAQDAARSAARVLSDRTVLSHNDLDPKNVLWQGTSPLIIDWEAAGAACLPIDIADTALYWSAGDEEKIAAFLRGYGACPDTDWRAALEACCCGKLDWLAYNIARMANPDEAALGEAQARAALGDIARHTRDLTRLARVFARGAREENANGA